MLNENRIILLLWLLILSIGLLGILVAAAITSP
jgi:hypothetical protein